MNIKKGDTILVLSGREKGKRGTVEVTSPTSNRVVVAGLNIRKRHLKPSKSSPRGGIAEISAPLPRASVMIVCPHCSKPSRVKMIISEQGSKYRACQHCQGSLDTK
jgi:large subunit ribosomal protein L24